MGTRWLALPSFLVALLFQVPHVMMATRTLETTFISWITAVQEI